MLQELPRARSFLSPRMSNERLHPNDRESVSEMTTGRLSVYLRCLTFLESISQTTVSSAELAERFHLNSSQIRKDLACFGEFGTRGVGYNVSRLKDQLVRELGLNRVRRVLIAGAGNLGMALADYGGFNDHGFEIAALVDNDPAKVGRVSRSGIEVLPWEELRTIVRERNVQIGIVAITARSQDEIGRPAHQPRVAFVLSEERRRRRLSEIDRLPAADRREDENLGSVPDLPGQPARVPETVSVHE